MVEERGCSAFEEWWEKEYEPQGPVNTGCIYYSTIIIERKAAKAAWDALGKRIVKGINEIYRGEDDKIL